MCPNFYHSCNMQHMRSVELSIKRKKLKSAKATS
uniref:Uncharacterized protein n=1 Tax=Anguilla anguilla TaxID=7936 RepID=A0A0E9UPN6_ANGAN